jgi:hypothetical protein
MEPSNWRMSRSGRIYALAIGHARGLARSLARWTDSHGDPIAARVIRGVRLGVGQVCGKAGNSPRTGCAPTGRASPSWTCAWAAAGALRKDRQVLPERPATPTLSSRSFGLLERSQTIFRPWFTATVAQRLRGAEGSETLPESWPPAPPNSRKTPRQTARLARLYASEPPPPCHQIAAVVTLG